MSLVSSEMGQHMSACVDNQAWNEEFKACAPTSEEKFNSRTRPKFCDDGFHFVRRYGKCIRGVYRGQQEEGQFRKWLRPWVKVPLPYEAPTLSAIITSSWRPFYVPPLPPGGGSFIPIPVDDSAPGGDDGLGGGGGGGGGGIGGGGGGGDGEESGEGGRPPGGGDDKPTSDGPPAATPAGEEEEKPQEGRSKKNAKKSNPKGGKKSKSNSRKG